MPYESVVTIRLALIILLAMHWLYVAYGRLLAPSRFCVQPTCRRHISYVQWRRANGRCAACAMQAERTNHD